MAPEHEARTRVLYDHESEETGRRRRAAADWGVGEDIFDRMPSRRFTRAERRAAHSGTVVISRAPEVDERPAVETRLDIEARRERVVESWGDDESWSEPEPRRFEPTFAEPRRSEPALALAEPPARLVAASTRPEPTVVLAPAADEPPARRTVLISGHPGGLPAARPARPPMTALERVGTRPDRILAYAVALGFLLVLIAILTTGQ